MTSVLPSTVEELNLLHSVVDPANMYVKASNQGFENIIVEKKFKREISLPNGVENWNISNFESYLNFEDNLEVIETRDDRLVPEGDQRPRCESISSVSSIMDDKYSVYPLGLKTFSTICMDSGSTCVSSDHSYVNPNATVFKGLDAAETYENLDRFLQQVPDLNTNDTMSSTLSSVSSPRNDSSLELSPLSNNFSMSTSYSSNALDETLTLKRMVETTSVDDIFLLNPAKRLCDAPEENRYHEIRRKNNLASKNCRKTRKEKQKEMEVKVAELEKERESLKVEVKLLEELIEAHKAQLYAILQQR